MTLNVLFLAAEAEPFIKVGGLGDVAGALPEAIHHATRSGSDLPEVDIRLVIPYHYAIKERDFDTHLIGEFDVPKVDGSEKCQVYRYDKGVIPIYLLDGDPIDDKSPVYSIDPILDGYKFVFFSLAALELPHFLNWRVDILQANDWHTATSVYALTKKRFRKGPLKDTRTIHTLHNMPFMGFGVQQALTDYGLPPIDDPILPEWARHAPLPMGLYSADRIIAVSPHYAEEILTPEFGCGLDDFLKTRKDVISGILNGLDAERWDPQTDPNLSQNYDQESLGLRKKNKETLQKQFNLEINPETPLLTIVSRMDPQKGIDIALRGLQHCKNEDWQAIILGTGIPYVEEMALQLEVDYPDRVRSIIKFDGKLAHQLYAGADIFMMPSRYEPCGLSQLISMRYGCVPIARATGGLADTIHYSPRKPQESTGILFTKPYPSAFATALKRTFRLYQKPDIWSQIQANGMRADFSWEYSARKYVAAYEELLGASK
ncbi:glycogen synthase [Chloroflexota bacterium]|nr:glycogen synthase [Chloroflexota bacterium]